MGERTFCRSGKWFLGFCKLALVSSPRTLAASGGKKSEKTRLRKLIEVWRFFFFFH